MRQLPSGRWQVRDGQRSYGTYLTQKAAEDVLRHLDEAPSGSKGRIPFGIFMERDFMPFQQTQVRASSYTNDEIALRLRLDGFKHVRLESITPQMVDTWFHSMPAGTPRRTAYGLLSKAMRYAVKWGHIKTNPCMVEGGHADTSKTRPTFTIEDYRKVLQQVPEHYRPFFQVMFAGHLRLGEALALTWADWDASNSVVSITKQIDMHGRTTETKTGQHRSVVLLQDGVDALRSLPRGIGNAPVFLGARGGRQAERTTMVRIWKRARERAGLPTFHIHDLRHVGLSLVAESGASLKDIQTRGGHATVQAAMRYQHTTTERDVAIAEKVSALLA